MSLRDLTKAKHTEAESTAFMKAVFDHDMPFHIWMDFTYNKMFFYEAIENKARIEGWLDGIESICRAQALNDDYKEMGGFCMISDVTRDYCNYIVSLEQGKVLAHLYTWHMGDLHGGQLIKTLIDAPHRNLEFDDRIGIINTLREKLDDSLGDEANTAFDWAIRIMKEYDESLNT